jgi:dihydrofolate synthase/folylpolyglutamate synthase
VIVAADSPDQPVKREASPHAGLGPSTGGFHGREDDWRTQLFSRRTFGMRFDTEMMQRVLDVLLPGVRENPPFDVVHVVGTNGKGSTCAMVDHALRALGHRGVGLYTSPHLERVGERIRLDGRALPDETIQTDVAELAHAEAEAGVRLSFYEVLTAIALHRFVEAGCRYVVLEAGIGGRLDATSVVRPRVVGIAHIAFDHEKYLGNTLAAIAGEKAAVIRAGVPVFSSLQEPEARAVIEARASSVGARLEFVEPLARAPAGLVGAHQRSNAALALALVRELDPSATPACLDGVRWPGRLERVDVGGGGVLWLDVAHNLDGIDALSAALDEQRIAVSTIVFGTMADKPAPAMAARLRQHAPLWLVPPARTEAFDLDAYAAPGERRFTGPDDPDLLDGIRERLRAGDAVLICGSHYLVGGLRARLRDPGAEVDGPERSDPVGRN